MENSSDKAVLDTVGCLMKKNRPSSSAVKTAATTKRNIFMVLSLEVKCLARVRIPVYGVGGVLLKAAVNEDLLLKSLLLDH